MVAVALVGGLVAVDGVSHLVANFPLARRANFFIRIGKVACQMRRRLAKRLPLARAFYRVGRTGFYVVLLSAPYCFCYNL